jgi:hypothetical protein
MKMIMIMMPIVKVSQLIKTHQINNISYTILSLITNFNFLCPYEFSNKINKINIYFYKFNNEHPQPLHIQSTKIFTKLQIPSQKNDPKNLSMYNLYFIYIVAYNF